MDGQAQADVEMDLQATTPSTGRRLRKTPQRHQRTAKDREKDKENAAMHANGEEDEQQPTQQPEQQQLEQQQPKQDSEDDCWVVVDAPGGIEPLLEATGEQGSVTEVLLGTDRPFKQLVAALSEIRDTVDLRLPTIVACGSQSHGKSSTLERIAMTEVFPRAEQRCTKMVVRLLLRNTPAATKKEVRLRVFDTESSKPVALEQVAEVGVPDVFKAVMDAFHAKHRAGEPSVIDVRHELQVMIQSPDVPTIDLVDLPGIVSDSNEDASKGVTRQFLERKNTMVLVVASAADTSLVVNPAWPLVCETRNPVVVALTNVDNLPRNRNILKVLETAKTECIPQHQGAVRAIIPVVNRDNSADAVEARCTLREASKVERETLEKHLSARNTKFDPTMHGIHAVTHQLDLMLADFMSRVWSLKEMNNLATDLRGLLGEVHELGVKPSLLTGEQLAEALGTAWGGFLDLDVADWSRAVADEMSNKAGVGAGVQGSPEEARGEKEPSAAPRGVDADGEAMEISEDNGDEARGEEEIWPAAKPQKVPYGRRVHFFEQMEAEVAERMPQQMHAVLNAAKQLLDQAVLASSTPPICLARFPAVREQCAASLESMFKSKKKDMVAEIQRQSCVVLDETLLSLETSIVEPAAVRGELRDVVFKAVSRTLLSTSKFMRVMQTWLDQNAAAKLHEACADRRKALERKIELVREAKDALLALAPGSDGADDTADNSMEPNGPQDDANASKALAEQLAAAIDRYQCGVDGDKTAAPPLTFLAPAGLLPAIEDMKDAPAAMVLALFERLAADASLRKSKAASSLSCDLVKPLHWAARTGRADVAKLLIERGADLEEPLRAV